MRGACGVFRLCIAVSWAALTASVEPAHADLVCKYESEVPAVPACIPASALSDNLSNRMRQSRILFENKLCRVDEITLSGSAEWPPPPPFEVSIYLRYGCSSQNEPAQSTAARKLKYTATARYQFSCALRQYKFFASGFDIRNDGTRSHWDSQGSSREIPWQDLAVGNSDPHLTPLFQTWCD
jgi:hypothetical protein